MCNKNENPYLDTRGKNPGQRSTPSSGGGGGGHHSTPHGLRANARAQRSPRHLLHPWTRGRPSTISIPCTPGTPRCSSAYQLWNLGFERGVCGGCLRRPRELVHLLCYTSPRTSARTSCWSLVNTPVSDPSRCLTLSTSPCTTSYMITVCMAYILLSLFLDYPEGLWCIAREQLLA